MGRTTFPPVSSSIPNAKMTVRAGWNLPLSRRSSMADLSSQPGIRLALGYVRSPTYRIPIKPDLSSDEPLPQIYVPSYSPPYGS